MRTTGIIAIGVAVALALALAGYAVAAGDRGTIATYTGCLKNGKLESLAVGDAPLAPCEAAQPPVPLSGGDITSVSAGPGLIGAADTGAVTLEVDRSAVQSRVVGGCERDRLGPIDASIRAIHPDGSVSCNSDDAGPGTDVFAGFHDGPSGCPSMPRQRRSRSPGSRSRPGSTSSRRRSTSRPPRSDGSMPPAS